MNEIAHTDYAYLCGAVELYNAGINDFTGSLPPKDGSSGAYINSFRYKLHLHAEDKKPVRIEASWYYGVYAFESTDPSVITTKEFEPSDKGVEEAIAWLQAEYNRT